MRVSRHLTPEEKAVRLVEWAAYLAERLPDVARGNWRAGDPDPDVHPYCLRLLRVPGICTIQSCAGHGSARDGFVESPGTFWIRLSPELADAFDARAFELARHEDVERVSRVYDEREGEFVEILFAGNERERLATSALFIVGFFERLGGEQNA